MKRHGRGVRLSVLYCTVANYNIDTQQLLDVAIQIHNRLYYNNADLHNNTLVYYQYCFQSNSLAILISCLSWVSC